MGGSYYHEELEAKKDEIRIGEAVTALKAHPNYEEKQPHKGESLTAFTLRCIAHLVSPPMIEGEHNEIECTDLANAILSMEKEITHRWVQSLEIGGANETQIIL